MPRDPSAKIDPLKPIGQPVIKDLYDISDEALGQLKTYIEQSGLKIPVSQLQGSAEVGGSPTVQDVVDGLVSLGLFIQG